MLGRNKWNTRTKRIIRTKLEEKRQSEYNERNEANKKLNIKRNKQIIVHIYDWKKPPIM